jgi:hypothetical protein
MDFGIGENLIALLVEQGDRVAGRARPSFQIRDADGHSQGGCESAEVLDEVFITGDGQGSPRVMSRRTGGIEAAAADAPHFGEDCQVRSGAGGCPAKDFAFAKVRIEVSPE